VLKVNEIVKGLEDVRLWLEDGIYISARGESIKVADALERVNSAIEVLKDLETIHFEGTTLNPDDVVKIGDIMECLHGLTLSSDAAFQAVGLIEWAMGKRAISRDDLPKLMEPRVLTLDEMLDPEWYHDSHAPFWLELRDSELFPAIVQYTPYRCPLDYITVIKRGAYMFDQFEQKEYGIEWRSWSALPSQKQREETGWWGYGPKRQ